MQLAQHDTSTVAFRSQLASFLFIPASIFITVALSALSIWCAVGFGSLNIRTRPWGAGCEPFGGVIKGESGNIWR